MSNCLPAEARRVQYELEKQIDDNPTIISRFALIQGDGLNVQDQLSWFSSFRSLVVDLPRATWLAQTTDTTTTRHLFIAMVPSNYLLGPNPAVGQQVRLLTVNGEDLGKFIINFVSSERYKGSVYAFRLILEQAQ